MSRLPQSLETPRLILRIPELSDAPLLNAAIEESFAELSAWMPWAAEPQSLEQTEIFCVTAREQWQKDVRYSVIMVRKDDGMIVGGTGYPYLDWAVPRFEIGYWCRTSLVGRGYVSEATRALALLAFDELAATRVELRMDDANENSWRVAERLGFELEGVLRAEARNNRGGISDTRVYAVIDKDRLGGVR